MNAANFSGNILSWTGTLSGTKFGYNEIYSAVIELTPAQGYKFQAGLTQNDFTCTNPGVTITAYNATMQRLTVQFPKTEADTPVDPGGDGLYITYMQASSPTSTPKLDIPLASFTDLIGTATELLTNDIWDAGYTEETFPYECIVTYNVSGTDKIYPVPWSDFVADPNQSSGANTITAWEYSDGIISFFSYSNTTSEPLSIVIRSKGNPEPGPTPQQITSPTLTIPTAPVALANQSTVTINGTNFTGTIISWSPTLISSTFAYATTYNAVIQLTPNSNYEFASSLTYTDFNVTGATATAYNSTLLQLTVQFAQTGADPAPQQITSPTLTIPTAPVALANQSTVTINGTNFTGSIVSWSPTLTSGIFAYATTYSATIQLMPNSNYEFASGLTYTDFNVTGATATAYNAIQLQLTVQFAQTGADPGGSSDELYITYLQAASPTSTPRLDIPLSSFTDSLGTAAQLLTDDIWDAGYTEQTFPYECVVTYNVSGTDKIYPVPWSDFVPDPNASSGANTITAWEYSDGIISFFSYSNTTSEPLEIVIKSKEA